MLNIENKVDSLRIGVRGSPLFNSVRRRHIIRETLMSRLINGTGATFIKLESKVELAALTP